MVDVSVDTSECRAGERRADQAGVREVEDVSLQRSVVEDLRFLAVER